MCGFSFDFCRTGEKVQENLIRTILHRGPDEIQSLHLEDGSCAISFCRLAIRDIAEGSQPLVTESFVSCFNGELYNQKEIENWIIQIDSNLEIPKGDMNVLALYLYLTDGCGIANVLGMFSGFIFFRNFSKVMLFRDPTGEKPIFYKISESQVSILSEHRFLYQNEETPIQLSRIELIQGFWETNPNKSVALCPPGTFTTISLKTGLVDCTKYWSWPSNSFENSAVSLDSLESTLKEVIESQLTSDVPVALLLSSGIDSSLIASYAQEVSSKPLTAFTLGFDENSWNESVNARRIANFIGIEHVTIKYSYQELANFIPQVLEAMDIPLFDSAAISLFALCKEIGLQHKVAIGGDGGDELTRGYDLLRHEANLLRARNSNLHKVIPHKFVSFLMQMHSGKYNSLRMKLGRAFSILENENLPVPLLALSPFAGTRALDHLVKHSKVELNLSDSYDAEEYYREKILPNVFLLKSDRLSMANSIELRSPFLDKRLIECTSKISAQEHLNFGKKSFLGALSKRRFPVELIQRKKHGFSPPLSQILKHFQQPNWSPLLLKLFGDDIARIWCLARVNQNHASAAWALLVCNHFISTERLDVDALLVDF